MEQEHTEGRQGKPVSAYNESGIVDHSDHWFYSAYRCQISAYAAPEEVEYDASEWNRICGTVHFVYRISSDRDI